MYFMIICGIFLTLWYLVYNKILIDCALCKEYALWTLDRRCFPWLRLGNIGSIAGSQNILFPMGTINKC